MALSARQLQDIERAHPEGLSSREIIDLLDAAGEPLTEATLRKYVQLGLLPRSRRVGQKGKHRGSRGIYPVEVIRRVDEIRRAMDRGETLDELARAAQAVRAKLSHVRVSMEEVLGAAELDLSGRSLQRSAKGPLRSELSELKRDAKAWLKSLERWSGELERASRGSGGGPRRKAANDKNGKTAPRRSAAAKSARPAAGATAHPAPRATKTGRAAKAPGRPAGARGRK